MSRTINRRKFFRNTTLSTAGLIMGGNLVDLSAKDSTASESYDIMNMLTFMAVKLRPR